MRYAIDPTKIHNELGWLPETKFEDGIVYVQMLGACVGCASMDSTLKDGIEQILLEEVPGVIGVENIEEYLA